MSSLSTMKHAADCTKVDLGQCLVGYICSGKCPAMLEFLVQPGFKDLNQDIWPGQSYPGTLYGLSAVIPQVDGLSGYALMDEACASAELDAVGGAKTVCKRKDG